MNNGAFAFSTETAIRNTQRLIEVVAANNNVRKDAALPIAAENAGLSPGCIEHIARERVKDVSVRKSGLIRNALIRNLSHAVRATQEEIAAVIKEAQAEYHQAKLAANRPDDDEVFLAQENLEAVIAEAQAIIKDEDLA